LYRIVTLSEQAFCVSAAINRNSLFTYDECSRRGSDVSITDAAKGYQT